MTTIINKSVNWLNREPAEIVAELLRVLAAYPLDSTYEEYGNFIDTKAVNVRGLPLYPEAPDAVHFWGNFANLSHGFMLGSNDPEVIEALTAAIRANQATPAYAEAKRVEMDRREHVRQHEERRAAESQREMLRRAGAMI